MPKDSPETLSLYYYDTCPFCLRVTRAIERLGAPVELRHVLREPARMQELVAARGRRTVPVLRIEGEGRDEWMPESGDIIAYLEQRFA